MARRVIRPPVVFADVGEVASFAEHLPDVFLLCREMGHNWRPWRAAWNADSGSYDRILMCQRCKTRREQVLSSGGHVMRSQYEYAEGYEHKGFGRISGEGRDRLRLESVVRAVKETDSKEKG